MASRNVPVPYSISQLQQQFEQFRTARTGRTKLPESLWQAAVEQAREHGENWKMASGPQGTRPVTYL
jgi:hypothetical protein